MAGQLSIDTKKAQIEAFKLRGRFIKFQRFLLAPALFDASEPIVAAAQANAPVLQTPKRGRQAGLLRSRIAPTLMKSKPGQVTIGVGPVRLTKNEKRFPFYGLFQEKGWTARGRKRRAPKGKVALARKVASGDLSTGRAIPGKHFLKRAGEANAEPAHQIFAARIFQRFKEMGIG